MCASRNNFARLFEANIDAGCIRPSRQNAPRENEGNSVPLQRKVEILKKIAAPSNARTVMKTKATAPRSSSSMGPIVPYLLLRLSREREREREREFVCRVYERNSDG